MCQKVYKKKKCTLAQDFQIHNSVSRNFHQIATADIIILEN